MRAGRNRGSASIVALAILLGIGSLAAGGALVLQAALTSISGSSERERFRRLLHEEGERIVALLAADPTPGSDSLLDPVWASLTSPRTPGLHAALEDVSSRLNANWVQKSLMQRKDFGDFLQRGRTAEELQQRRQDRGISPDIHTEYADLITADALDRYFSGYGYANLNTTDEFALRALYAIRMADTASAEAFRSHWQQTMIREKSVKRGDLREFLGLDYAKLFPVMNVEPTFNVHFIEPLLLTRLLSVSDWKIPRPAEAARLILDGRDRGEITPEGLRGMIGAPDDSMIFQYLGVTTWFWKISVALRAMGLQVIVARIPSERGSNARFLVVEERFLP